VIGIGYTILRQSDDQGPKPKTFYLTTHRAGAAGEALRAKFREHRRLSLALSRLAAGFDRAIKEQQAADPAATAPERLSALEEAVGRLTAEVAEATDRVEACCQEIVALSLRPNYGAETEAVLNQLSTRDLFGMVASIEEGQQPRDFFPHPEQPEKPSAT
jgi:hypothetical protein